MKIGIVLMQLIIKHTIIIIIAIAITIIQISIRIPKRHSHSIREHNHQAIHIRGDHSQREVLTTQIRQICNQQQQMAVVHIILIDQAINTGQVIVRTKLKVRVLRKRNLILMKVCVSLILIDHLVDHTKL